MNTLKDAEKLVQSGQIQQALQTYQEILKQSPDYAEAYRDLGTLYFNIGQRDVALAHLDKAVELDQGDPVAFCKQGAMLQHFSRFVDAERSFKKAVDLDASYEAGQSGYISNLERLNKIEEARVQLDKAKILLPDSPLLTIIEAVILKREGRIDEAIKVLERGNYPDDPMNRMRAYHELGMLYDRLENPDKAMENFKICNELAIKTWNINDQSRAIILNKIKTRKQVFTKEWVQSWTTTPEQTKHKPPVFLFSFARSGTTLLQHILDSHPKIHATEEVPAIPKIIEILEKQVGNIPASLATMPAESGRQFQDFYFKIHKQDRNWQDNGTLVDKYPMLTNEIGVVHRLFPHAKYIFAYRHPCDCILSSYMHFFAPNEAMLHSYRLDSIVNLYCEYMDLWEQYKECLPIDVYNVRYEDIVDTFEPTVQGVLDFLNIDWDDSVLAFDEAVREKGDVRTPSYSQVSEKIYKRAQYRWERYKKYLDPYMDQLTPYVKRLGYTA